MFPMIRVDFSLCCHTVLLCKVGIFMLPLFSPPQESLYLFLFEADSLSMKFYYLDSGMTLKSIYWYPLTLYQWLSQSKTSMWFVFLVNAFYFYPKNLNILRCTFHEIWNPFPCTKSSKNRTIKLLLQRYMFSDFESWKLLYHSCNLVQPKSPG